MTGPRVFETYKSDWEVFPDQPAVPMPWNTYPTTATVLGTVPPLAYPASKLILGSLKKVRQYHSARSRLRGGPGGPKPQAGSISCRLRSKEFGLIEDGASSMCRQEGRRSPARRRPSWSTQKPERFSSSPPGSKWTDWRPTRSRPSIRALALVQRSEGTVQRDTSSVWLDFMSSRRPSTARNGSGASFEHVRNAPLRGAADRRLDFQ